MRYAFAKEKADAAKLFVIGAVFEFTGAQEKEHAGIFLNHLRDTEGQNISIDGAYPVTETDSVIKLLESAYHQRDRGGGPRLPCVRRHRARGRV